MTPSNFFKKNMFCKAVKIYFSSNINDIVQIFGFNL